MNLNQRLAELLSEDRLLRLAICNRGDGCTQIVEERVWSYENNDAEHPLAVPFPADGSWSFRWMIHSTMRHGVFGSLDDALREAELVLRDAGQGA